MSSDSPLRLIILKSEEEWRRTILEYRNERHEDVLLLDVLDHTVSIFFQAAHGEHITELRWHVADPTRDYSWPSDWGVGETLWGEALVKETFAHAHEQPRHGPSDPGHHMRGKGVFTYPLGPVRADIAESLLYKLQVMGDEILHVTLDHNFKRRHIRDLVQNLTLDDALQVVSRFTTTSNVAHSLAFSLAIEQALGWSPPSFLMAQRIILAEMERCWSHLGDLASLAVSTGLPVPQMELLHLKEQLLGLNDYTFGHRYLRGLIHPGSQRFPNLSSTLWIETIEKTYAEAGKILTDLQHTPSFLDRLYGAGTIPEDVVSFIQPVGPVGRACGRPTDVRQWSRQIVYERYQLSVPHMAQNDAFSRFMVKAQELLESLRIMRTVLNENAWYASSSVKPLTTGASTETVQGIGVVEAPRGLLVYRVVFHPQSQTIIHLGVATPSQRNWYVVPAALDNHNILQDFPIVDASFNLSVAGWDG